MSGEPREILSRLSVAFPSQAIKQREGGQGRRFDYVETQTVIRRLNADAVAWDFQIKSLERHPLPPRRDGKGQDLYVCVGALTIPGLGTREGIGVQVVTEGGGEDLLKGVSSDALKKAGTLFGVALDLYGPDHEAGEVASAPAREQPPRRERTSHNAPQARQDRSGATKAPQQAVAPLSTGNEPLISQGAIANIGALAKDKGFEGTDLWRLVQEMYGKPLAELSMSQATELRREIKGGRRPKPADDAPIDDPSDEWERGQP